MPRGRPGTLTHGHSGYNHGCHCRICREGHREAARQSWRRRHARTAIVRDYGVKGGPEVVWVPVEKYRAIFRIVRRTHSVREIAKVTGLPNGTIWNIEKRGSAIRPETARKARKVVELLP